jgi:hypothetical protein
MKMHSRFGAMAAAWVALAACVSAQVPGKKETKGNMEGIMVTVTPANAAVLPGESLIVKSTVQNRGASAVTVPSAQAASPLSYRLEPDGTPGASRYDLSYELYYTQTRIGLASGSRLQIKENLPPGGVQLRSEDIALYNQQPFEIGKYRLTGAWTQGDYQAVSGFTRVVVSQPKIEAWSSEICRRSEELHSVFAHRREDGDVVIYERSSRSNRPEFGVFRPRVRLGKKTAVGGVAPAVILEDSGQGVWFAWMADGKLQVAGALADELNAQPPGQAVGVSNPVLVAPGFQLGPGRVVFFVAGGAQGGTALELWGASSSEVRRFWKAPLGPAGDIRVLARKVQGAPEFIVVVEERTKAGHRLWRRDYGLRGVRSEPRILAEFNKPLLAWGLEPTDYPSPAKLVVAHRGDGPEDVQAREVDLDGKGLGKPTDLPSMNGSADLWAVLSFDGRLHVTARRGDSIFYSEAGWTAWKAVGTVSPGPGWLHLFSPHSIKLWAEWCTVNKGPHRTQLLQTRDAIE